MTARLCCCFAEDPNAYPLVDLCCLRVIRSESSVTTESCFFFPDCESCSVCRFPRRGLRRRHRRLSFAIPIAVAASCNSVSAGRSCRSGERPHHPIFVTSSRSNFRGGKSSLTQGDCRLSTGPDTLAAFSVSHRTLDVAPVEQRSGGT